MFSRTLTAALLLTCFNGVALAQERVWSLDTPANQAYLIFGVPDTEDVGLSLWCEVGKGQMALYIPEPRIALRVGETVAMMITLDGAQKSLPSVAAKDAASGQMTVEGKFNLKDILVTRLQTAQSITVTVKGHANTFPFGDANFADLLSVCKGEDVN